MTSSRKTSVVFGGAASSTVLGLLLLIPLAINGYLHRAILIAMAIGLGWFSYGLIRFIRRYGRVAVAMVLATVALLMLWTGIEYRGDLPKRALVDEIKRLGAFYVGPTGEFWTGEIDYVYFDEKVGDAEVIQFTHLSGLDRLDRLVFKGSRVTDEPIARLAGFPSLRFVYIEGANVNPDTIERLRDQLPDCEIEVK